MPYADITAVSPSVTYYQRLHGLSDFHEHLSRATGLVLTSTANDYRIPIWEDITLVMKPKTLIITNRDGW